MCRLEHPELANLAATMAKMINGNLSANKKICDPAAGSGSLISSAMKVFNINGNQVVANDINPKLIELLSLRLGLNNPITINKSNAPVVTTKDILSFVPSDFNDIEVVLLNPKNEILNSTTTFGGGIYSRTVKVYSFI